MAPRVLIVAPTLLHSPTNPRGIRAARLCAGLDACGVEVDLASYWIGPGPPPHPQGCRRLYAESAGNPVGRIAHPLRRILWRGLHHLRNDPDGLRRWGSAIRARLRAEAEAERPDVVLAIGLPVGALIAGAAIAARLGLPFVADLGDPWRAGGRAERRGRARALGRAAALITTTPALAADLAADLAPGTPVLELPAGGEIRRRSALPAEPPLFVHLGAITPARVSPWAVFEVLGRLHREGRIEFRSHTYGFWDGIHRLAHPHLPALSHAEAIELTARASAALVLANTNREQLPSKAYEIACTETWALCVSELEPDPTCAVVRDSGHGVVAANDAAAIEAAVEEILAREARGERPAPAPEHSWGRRSERVAELVGELAGRGVGTESAAAG